MRAFTGKGVFKYKLLVVIINLQSMACELDPTPIKWSLMFAGRLVTINNSNHIVKIKGKF